jgi:UDP-glucose 6-dehydrogenase
MVYDIAEKLGGSWGPIQRAIESDPLICNRYANPVHKGGRGAGGFCFIKDMAAFARSYEKIAKEPLGTAFLNAAQKKNIALLSSSGKDHELLMGVYGSSAVRGGKKRSKSKRRK